MPELMHPTYLPFGEQQLLEHFAEVRLGGETDRHLAYYRNSVRDAAAYAEQLKGSTLTAVAPSRGLQMEKDERFWVVAALMSIFHGSDRITGLTAVLTRCFGAAPAFAGLSSWNEALGVDPKLYFEVNLPSPPAYAEHLATHLEERVLIPHLRARASARGARLEGTTKVDAMLVCDTGFAVLFEAKVLSDASSSVRYDVLRNQVARNIDVMLDANPRLSPPLRLRRPERTYLALITPEIFKTHPSSRLYGWLMPRYQDPGDGLLRDHLPHRAADELASVSHRLGWITWEDVNGLHPGACPWLPVG